MRRLLTTAALIAAAASPALAAPSLPTVASVEAVAAASCPDGVRPRPFAPVIIEIDPVAEADLHISAKAAGVEFAGAFRLSSPDGDLGALTGLGVYYGQLAAVSDSGHWVKTKLRWGRDRKAVGVEFASAAPMNGADGEPLADGDRPAGLWSLGGRTPLHFVAFPVSREVRAYALEGCGAAARGVPIFVMPSGPAPEVLAVTDYARGLFAGHDDGGGVRTATGIYPSVDVGLDPIVLELNEGDIQGPSGARLAGLAHPNRTTPAGLLGLWAPREGGLLLRSFDLPQYADVRMAARAPADLIAIDGVIPTAVWASAEGGEGLILLAVRLDDAARSPGLIVLRTSESQ